MNHTTSAAVIELRAMRLIVHAQALRLWAQAIRAAVLSGNRKLLQNVLAGAERASQDAAQDSAEIAQMHGDVK